MKEQIIRTENRQILKDSTKVFGTEERDEAVEYANKINSYIGDCYDNSRNWIGYYVPL